MKTKMYTYILNIYTYILNVYTYIQKAFMLISSHSYRKRKGMSERKEITFLVM